MHEYPSVLSEIETLQAVASGRSIARYGDGEFALVEGRSIRPQRGAPDLAARLRAILQGEAGACLVGIPNLVAPLPPTKATFWAKYTRCAALLNPQQSYVSSFITRPDNAPWLDVPSYWAQLDALWAGRDVTLVRGDDPNGTGAVSLVASDLTTARSVTEVIAPGVNAWASYRDILARIGRPDRALLCLGATATVLAVDLCALGVHAIDLGHVGMFLRRHRAGEPMQRVKASV
jgi:hypothetical protein